MPTYDYHCGTCDYVYTTTHSIKEDPEIRCLNCGAKPMSRLISPVPVHFKGRGWSDGGYNASN